MFKLQRILEQISWKTRTCNYRFSFLEMLVNDQGFNWGFNILKITSNYQDYCLLSFKVRFPNKTNVQKLTVTHWDFAFLRNYLVDIHERLSDTKLWTGSLPYWENIQFNILNKILR